jgi:tRNA threonylcarbamoyladenosine biosynthesis protein TsaB
MPVILHLETSTSVCSVALSVNGKLISDRISFEGPSHAVLLASFVDEILYDMRTQNMHPDAVAVSCGPGSYTGLRIGVSMAKGLCYGCNVPLIAVDTLQLLAYSALKATKLDDSLLICPMIDARRMEVFSAIFDQQLQFVRPIAADIVDDTTYLPWLANNLMLFLGNGADKCRMHIVHPNARFVTDIVPKASEMIELSEKAFLKGQFVDTAYFEPFYLKDFVATVPKNKVL